MGKTKTSGKGRLDKYYHLAKEQGYRSRAAFKLVQLDKKYQFLSKSHALLDLCAAPGGWLQVAVKYMPVSSVIIGVDLVPIRAIRGCTTFTQDITTPACRAEIKKILDGRLLDVVLHDGSPNVGGAWSKEALGQAALSLESLKLATEFLRPGGLFVSKVFRSQDYNALLFAFKQLFHRVEATKPVASRQTSAEIYVICQGYKAPGTIDPRLLDMRTIFQDVAEDPKPVDVFRTTNRKKFREGYEPGLSLVHKVSTATAFMRSDNAVEFLGTYHQIKFETDECKIIQKHKDTNEEIQDLCDDLQVLGKREFKQLLKWRMAIRREMPDLIKAPRGAAAEEAHDEGDKMEEDEEGEGEEGEAAAGEPADPEAQREEVIMEEMLELKDYLAARQKGFEKRVKKRREKAKVRAATGLSTDAVDEGLYQDDDLFSLVTIKTKKHLGRLDDAAMDEEQRALEEGEDEGEEGMEEEEESEDDDTGDLDENKFKRRYEEELEAYFDEAYDRYCKAKEGSSKRRARARLQGDEAEAEERDEEEAEEGGEGKEGGEDREVDGMEVGSGDEEGGAPGSENPLVVPESGRRETPMGRGERMAAQWFSQDVFQGLEMPQDTPGVPGASVGGKGPRAEEGGAGEKGKGGGKAAKVEAGKEKKEKKGKEEKSGGKEQAEAKRTKGGEVSVPSGPQAGAGKAQKGLAAVTAPAGSVAALVPNGKPIKGQGKHKSEGADGAPAKGRGKGGGAKGLVAASQEDGDFEVVPVAEDLSDSDPEKFDGSESDSDSDSGEEGRPRVEIDDEEYDSDDKAETLAYAHRMLRKRQRDDIIDSAYNRYTFDDDPKALPRWFQDDERKHLRAIQPITKEEVEAMKAEFRAVDARPAKKVAEAKARKRRRLMKAMEQVRQKATAIADQPDLNAKSKSRQMERLYKNAANNAKTDTKKEVVVAKKGNQGSRGRYAKGKIMVDRRMLADKRGEKNAAKKAKGKGGRGKGKAGKGATPKGGKSAGKKTGKGRGSAR